MQTNTSYFFIRYSGRFVKIAFRDIHYVEAYKNYCKIYTESHTYITLGNLKVIEEGLPREYFCRIHRSYLVALDKIIAFDKHTVDLPNKSLPVGDTFYPDLGRQLLVINGEWSVRKRQPSSFATIP